jgi:transcription initiation factor TFIIB
VTRKPKPTISTYDRTEDETETAGEDGEAVREQTEREQRRTETEDEGGALTCPECDGRVKRDGTETVCVDCGLVVDDERIDRGPEWRAFDAAERDEKSRVGAPTTKMMHDDGLSTNIGWQDKDAYGNSLSGRQRRKVQRMRTWNERFRTRNSKERNLKQALGEIERMSSALGLPQSVRETASMIYRQALKDDMLPGRSIEGIATASLHAAARMEQLPRSVDEIAAVSRVDEEEFKRAYRYINRELELEIQPPDPNEYLPRFASELDVDEETKLRARRLLETGKRANLHSGKSPVGLAAAAIYAAAQFTPDALTQSEVAKVTDISEVTIRNRYQELLEAEDERITGGGEPPLAA